MKMISSLMSLHCEEMLGRTACSIRWNHLSNESFGGDVLFVRPSDCSILDSDLVEVAHITQLAKYAVIKIRRHVKNTLAPVLNFHLDAVILQRYDIFYVPEHDTCFIADRSYRGFLRWLQDPNQQ